jgi:hypothetical protein
VDDYKEWKADKSMIITLVIIFFFTLFVSFRFKLKNNFSLELKKMVLVDEDDELTEDYTQENMTYGKYYI